MGDEDMSGDLNKAAGEVLDLLDDPEIFRAHQVFGEAVIELVRVLREADASDLSIAGMIGGACSTTLMGALK